MTYPSFVRICEVGPRDGFQFEARPIPLDLKIRTIERLVGAGVRRIQVTSFVHPRLVPQMADAREVISRLPRRDDVTFSALALNMRGVDRAAEAGVRAIDLSIATNERHSRDNANVSVEEGLENAVQMVERCMELGLDVQIGFQTVFGYSAPGDTPVELLQHMTERFAKYQIESLSLADTTGLADPLLIHDRIARVREIAPSAPLVLHLHDTRGMGLANVIAALQANVDRFDTSFGGLGGCPFLPGASGNVATEDVVGMLHQMGIDTGVDEMRVSEIARDFASFLGHPLPGKRHTLGGRE
jgi:hydroxymethylglutaryl-CoA lyase